MNEFYGVIIEDSLLDKKVLDRVQIISTRIENVTEKHKTPWLKHWTLHDVEVTEQDADLTAQKISRVLDNKHPWLADFKNSRKHYIIFRNRVFKINRREKEQYDKAMAYGISLGMPDFLVDFSASVKPKKMKKPKKK